ncbi:MAG: mannitol-1-phosphate 5-dehydrogenase [Clostridia bacterium]|nr:mannitol-1-phosphate 5-dehydrogenase [Clostridia bacterium]
MKKAVHFGAGKIGRGFIAELLHDSGYEVVFGDVVEELVDLVNKNREYPLFLIDHNFEEKIIDNVIAYSNIKESDKLIDAMCEAEIITTSVMATNLPKVAPLIAQGLKKRLEQSKDKVIVMACENAIMGTDILKNAMIETKILTKDQINSIAVFPNTAVDRMVFGGVHNGKEGIEIGDAFELVIEKGKLIDPNSEPIKGAEYVDDLMMYLQRKIYIINCGHAIAGYYGQVLKGYDIVQDALRDPELLPQIREAMLESASALEKKYGFTHESLVEYMETMMVKRFTTPGVVDPISRVSREPIRKISPNDRIMGPANNCEEYGLDNTYLLKGVACALKFKSEGDLQAEELQNYIANNGIEAAIVKYTGVEKDSRMYNVILDEYKKLLNYKFLEI